MVKLQDPRLANEYKQRFIEDDGLKPTDQDFVTIERQAPYLALHEFIDRAHIASARRDYKEERRQYVAAYLWLQSEYEKGKFINDETYYRYSFELLTKIIGLVDSETGAIQNTVRNNVKIAGVNPQAPNPFAGINTVAVTKKTPEFLIGRTRDQVKHRTAGTARGK